MDVSIIIVNFNTCKLTAECLNSIFKYTKQISFEVILVDNASIDGSKSFFDIYDNITYIYNETNVGFGCANNIGAQRAEGKYLLLLNSDTLLYRNTIKEMFDFANANQHLNIGAIGSILEDGNGKYSLSFEQFLSSKSILHNLLKRIIPTKSYQTQKITELTQKPYSFVDYIIGADLFIPISVFKYLKGFDSNYFMFYEEEDIQKRMKLMGKNRIILNKKGIIHLESQSFPNNITFKRSMLMRQSSFIYIQKHFKTVEYIAIHVLYFGVRLKNILLNYRHFTLDQKIRFLF